MSTHGNEHLKGMDTDNSKSTTDSLSSLTVLTEHLETFMTAWDENPPPEIAEFLPHDQNIRQAVLVELIKLDLEYRWGEGIDPMYLEDYLRIIPEHQLTDIPLDLIYEEYHVRRTAGLEVDANEYVKRFPKQESEIRRLLDDGGTTQSLSLANRTSKKILEGLTPGQRFDDFDLILKLGEGSFAKVFLAKQESMQRLVALKISADRGNEAETLSQFDHDYIVRVYDQRILPDQGIRLLYMQYVSGGTLHDVIQAIQSTPKDQRSGKILFDTVDRQLQKRGEGRQSRSPWRQELEHADWVDTTCWLGACLAEGLAHSHQQKVLHRDIKPANVLLTREGIPKLADFNISYCSKVAGVSPARYFGGSLSYMSPEQLEACNPFHSREPDSIEARSDIFSLGVVLFELLVGTRPFCDSSPISGERDLLGRMTQSRRRGEFAFPDDYNIPEIVRSTISRCLATEPDDRWQSATQLQKRLALCSQPKIRRYLFPASTDYRQRLLPHSRLLMIIGFLLPNALAAIFNFFYNEAKIIQPMSIQLGDGAESINQHFVIVQGVINLIAFPLGIYLNDYFIRKSLEATRTSLPIGQQEHWMPILNVGFRCALLALLMWTLAGMAYPLSMSIQAVDVSVQLYSHFFFSLLLCGLFAVALTYFNLTVYSLLILVPEAIRRGADERGIGKHISTLGRHNWIFLLTSAVVPMLASVALAFLSDQTPWVLGVISLGGMLAFGLCLWQMNRIQIASRRLESAFQGNPEAGF